MSYSNAYGSYFLPQEVRTRLHQINYANDFGAGSVDSFQTHKDRILSGTTILQILSDTRFKATMSGAHFNEGLCRGHYFGVRRMHRLGRATELLAGERWATAWTLTTCYYTAFFAAIELLKLTGKYVSYFSSDEIDEVNMLAPPSPDLLASGTYIGQATYNPSSDEVEIAYFRGTHKPHHYAWHELKELVDHTSASTSDASRHRETLRRILGVRPYAFSPPNDIRNRWNYVDATLFCERGENIGSGMIDRILDQENACRWGGGKNHVITEQNEAIGLAYLRTTLVEATDQVATAVLPEKLVKKRSM